MFVAYLDLIDSQPRSDSMTWRCETNHRIHLSKLFVLTCVRKEGDKVSKTAQGMGGVTGYV